MDPLSSQELSAVTRVLDGGDYGDFVNLYPLITLHEPAKAEVLRRKPGDTLSRRAFVIARGRSRTYEAVVDLSQGKVTSWKLVEGVQPNVLLSEEWSFARKIVISNLACRSQPAQSEPSELTGQRVHRVFGAGIATSPDR